MTLAFQGSNAWQSGNLAARNSAVHCHAVSKHYGAVQALADFNLEVPPGKLVAVLGPNGAGKTTAIKLLLGLVRRQWSGSGSPSRSMSLLTYSRKREPDPCSV